jgi:cell division protein ZipA
MGCGSSGSGDERVRVRVGGEELYVSTASASRARVRGVLPTKGSEDVSNLLGSIDSQAQPRKGESKPDYLPDTATDWVVDVRFDGDPRLDPQRVSDLFGAEWRRRHGGLTIYALDPNTKHWTFLISANGPKQVTQLKISWNFIDFTDDSAPPSSQVFSDREKAVREAVKTLGVANLKASLAPDEAARRAIWLREFKARLDYSPAIVLRAPQGQKFEGKDIWDVMLCLGLKWGDMDVFHWENSGGLGDDSFFSVWTSTSPGYFLPEAIAAGNVHVDDLVFGFSAPRCTEPGQVFESMVRAVQYAQRRLGGAIDDEMGGEAKLDEIRRKIQAVEQESKTNGFTPGGDSALHLF